MSQLLLSAVALALISLSLLVTVFYVVGGFNDGTAKSLAMSSLNQAKQITNALSFYKVNNGGDYPSTLNELTVDSGDGTYLSGVPQFSGDFGGSPAWVRGQSVGANDAAATRNTSGYLLSGPILNDEVCLAVEKEKDKTYTSLPSYTNAVVVGNAVSSTLPPAAGIFGCYQDGVTPGTFQIYYQYR